MNGELFQQILTVGISVFGGGAVWGFFKDRKKDAATARLSNAEAAQKEIIAMSEMMAFIRKENKQLQLDLEAETEKSRIYRERLIRVEEELYVLQRRCQDLGNQLRELTREDAAGGHHPAPES